MILFFCYWVVLFIIHLAFVLTLYWFFCTHTCSASKERFSCYWPTEDLLWVNFFLASALLLLCLYPFSILLRFCFYPFPTLVLLLHRFYYAFSLLLPCFLHSSALLFLPLCFCSDTHLNLYRFDLAFLPTLPCSFSTSVLLLSIFHPAFVLLVYCFRPISAIIPIFFFGSDLPSPYSHTVSVLLLVNSCPASFSLLNCFFAAFALLLPCFRTDSIQFSFVFFFMYIFYFNPAYNDHALCFCLFS